MDLIGYHGTSAENESSIVSGNFNVSANDDEWLGTGAYFFVHGISDPEDDARRWAVVQAYDNKKKQNKYDKYVVLKAEISVDSALELDTNEGLNAFNSYRDGIIELMRRNRLKLNKSLLQNDCLICNLLMDKSGFDAIIRKEFIKFDSYIRKIRYQSRIPNCRIMSVRNPNTSVHNSIQVTKRGDV